MSLSAGLDLSARPNDEVKKKKTATCTIYSEAGPDDGPRERRTPERLYTYEESAARERTYPHDLICQTKKGVSWFLFNCALRLDTRERQESSRPSAPNSLSHCHLIGGPLPFSPGRRRRGLRGWG